MNTIVDLAKSLAIVSLFALAGCAQGSSAFTSTLVCRDANRNETYRVTGEGRWIPYKTDSLYNTYTLSTYQKRRGESCAVNVTVK